MAESVMVPRSYVGSASSPAEDERTEPPAAASQTDAAEVACQRATLPGPACRRMRSSLKIGPKTVMKDMQ